MILSLVALLWIGRGQAIRGDNLEYAARLATQGLGHSLLHTPPNKYLIAVPLFIYRVMFGIFGMSDYFPYRLLAVVLVVICGGLFFELIRRQIGYLLALPPTILILFFGSGWEEVLTGIRIPSLIAVACGLGALLAISRRELLWDALAAALLCAAVASHPTGVAFTAAVAVVVILSPPDQWKRAWVFLLPIAVFGAWYLIWRTTTPAPFPNTFSDVFLFVRQSWVMITATVTGLSGVLPIPVYRQPIAEIAGGLLFALVAVVTVLRFRRLPAIYWGLVLGLLVLVASTRLTAGGFLRRPDEVRYLLPETIVFLLMLAALVWGVKLPRWVQGAVAVVLLLGVAANVHMLVNGGDTTRKTSQVTVGEMSAYRIAGPDLRPGYQPGDFDPAAGLVLAAMNRFGSPALTPAELLQASLLTRTSADRALVGGLTIRPEPTSQPPPQNGTPPRVVNTVGGRTTRRGGCVYIKPSPASSGKQALAELILPLQGVQISAPEISRVQLSLGRFAPPVVQLPSAKGRSAILKPPAAQAATPWKLGLASAQPASVCGL